MHNPIAVDTGMPGLDTYVAAAVAEAPPLHPSQADRLAVLWAGTRAHLDDLEAAA